MERYLDQLEAYELMQQRPLDDINSQGFYLVHKKSGAKICVVSNDDENKVFFVAFRTPPRDSCGTPHIIEHTVLCGSEKFPLKDPFMELLKGSMNTFLNAITFPDKTMYPVASCNDKDFHNLMDVYLDSVFSPNIYKEQNIFRQEGWRYELDSPEDELTINGVVYNEMKGAYSSGDDVLEQEILNSLFPDTPYHFSSGGDPQVIPQLTYENYLDFHRTYYHPSNSYIYLYGDMDMAGQLKWLDEEYLSKYDRIDPGSALPLQKAFDKPEYTQKSYSISSAESTEKNTYLSCSWAIGTNLDADRYVAFDILSYALLSSQGAPLKKALIDAGIGEDIDGGYDSSEYQPVFSVIARKADASDQERFLEIIRDVLKEQAEGGLNKRTILAAINGAEFRFREADFGRIPKGLVYGMQIMDSWLYDDDSVFLHMDEIAVYDRLRELAKTDYFENLIKEYLLDNDHCAIVTVVPETGLNAKKEQELADSLKAYKQSLTDEEIEKLVSDTKALKAYQEEPTPPEDLRKIPLLSRDDMKKKSDPYSNIDIEAEGVHYLWHDYETNGIVYLDMLFDVNHIPEEKVPYLALLQTLIGRLDTTDYTYARLSDEVNMYTGGIGTSILVLDDGEDGDDYCARFEVRVKTLSANLNKAVELTKSMMLDTLYEDDKRIYEVLAQTKARLQAELSETGNAVSANRALSYYSRKARYSDMTKGIAFYRTLEDVTADYESVKEDIKEELKSLADAVFGRENLLVSCTCRKEQMDMVTALLGKIGAGLSESAPEGRSSVSLPDQKNEAFMDASQIQYVSLAGNYSGEGYEFTGVLDIFRTIMNYEYLWQNIRVLGGAYGCSCSVTRRGDVVFSSYRDPNLGSTLETYRAAADYIESFDVDERDMTKFIIGTFSSIDAPSGPSALGRRSLYAYLSGVKWEDIQKEREQILAAGPQDIRALAKMLRAASEKSYVCAVGNEERIKQEADLFDKTEHLSGGGE